MSDKLYLLVCDDCYGDGESKVEYVMCGTKEDVLDEMRNEYETCSGLPAKCFDDGDVEWTYKDKGQDSAWLSVDTEEIGCDRHIGWWMVELGAKPDNGPLFALVKGVNNDGGGIDVNLLGTYTDFDLGQRAMLHEYGMELVKPSFYAGWDPEYCRCDATSAVCEVETMDMTVSLDLLTVVNYANRTCEKIEVSFEYLG